MSILRGLLCSVAIIVVAGCAQKNPNEAIFRKAASGLPAAQAEATRAGLDYKVAHLDRHVPVSENASFHYRRADEVFNRAHLLREEIAVIKHDAFFLPEGRKFLKDSAPSLDEIDKGCALPHCDFQGALAKNGSAESLQLSTFNDDYKLLMTRAMVEAHDRDYGAASNDFGRLAKLVKHLMEEPAFMNASFAQALIYAAHGYAEMIMKDAHGDPACAKALREGMSKFPVRLNLQAVVQNEASHEYEMYSPLNPSALDKALYESLRGNPMFGDRREEWDKLQNSISTLDRRVVMNAFRDRSLQFHTALYEAASCPSITDTERIDKIQSQAAQEGSLDLSHTLNVFDAPWIFSRSVFLGYEAYREVTLAGLDHLANPGGLGVDASAKHLDPFTGQPLHFLKKQGGFIVYSLGSKFEFAKDQTNPANDISFEYPPASKSRRQP